MAIRLQILHGNEAPTKDNLLPYELGWSINNKSLYVGSSDGNAPIQLTYGVGALPIENGGTGATSAAGIIKNLKLIPETGGTFTGELTLKKNTKLISPDRYYHLYFQDKNDKHNCAIISDKNDETGISSLRFRQWINTAGTNQVSGNYEDFFLPSTRPQDTPENKSYSILTTKNLVEIEQGGTGANNAADARTSLKVAHSLVLKNNYFGLIHNDGSEGAFIRTTQDGIIPYSADSESGKSYVGTKNWPFAAMYAKNFYGNVTGNVTGDVVGNVKGNVLGRLYLKTTGTSWENASNSAMVRPSYTWESSSQYIPIFSVPTKLGDWSVGTLQDGTDNYETLFFVYKVNETSATTKYFIGKDGKFSGRIDWSHIDGTLFNEHNILPPEYGGTGTSSKKTFRTDLGIIQPGDIITIPDGSTPIGSGCVSAGKETLRFFIPVGAISSNVTGVTLSGRIVIRYGGGGYVAEADYHKDGMLLSNYNVTTKLIRELGIVNVYIEKTDKGTFGNAGNNAVIAVESYLPNDLKITFSGNP